MNFIEVFRLLSIYLHFLSLVFIVPLGVAAYYDYFCDETVGIFPQSTFSFVLTIVITYLCALICKFLGRKAEKKAFRREFILVAVSIWGLASIFGALPFWLSGTLTSFNDACFESISGFTTTGASVMHPKKYDELSGEEIPWEVSFNEGSLRTHYHFYGTIVPVRDETGKEIYSGIEAVSKGILFWRSFAQWIGGGGIVVVLVAVLPVFGVGGKLLMHTEVTGPVKEDVVPKIRDSALVFWRLYVGFTIAQTLLLKLVNEALPWFDALTITFATLSTGGLSIRNSSIGSYQHAGMDWVIIVFMLVGSINFSNFYHLFRGKIYRFFDTELRYYLLSIVIGGAIIITSLYTRLGIGSGIVHEGTVQLSFLDAVRYGLFNLISAQTSTGFATADYDIWPYLDQALLLIVMYIGGMAGSTAGGIKIIRHLILAKIFFKELEYAYRPEVVKQLKVGGAVIDEKVQSNVLSFFFIMIACSVVGTFLFILDGLDPETAIGINTCMINNTGLAFRAGGPTQSCAFLPPLSTLISSIWMILGRLEFLAVLVLFMPRFWKQN